MERRRPPDTAAGYYALHDFRRIDWSAWMQLSEDDRRDIVREVSDFLEAESNDADGDLACFSVQGHEADLLLLVLRPTMAAIDTLEREFQRLDFSRFTKRATSAIGVTEASGYTEGARAFFDEDAEADPGIRRYMESRLYPDIPNAEFVSFYFMNKRRQPDANWYDLPYEERAEHIANHGDIGRDYAGRVTQMITGTTGFDDWEWGITLFANDMTAIKDLLVEMRFDPSTSRFAEFGSFSVGRQFVPGDIDRFLAGEDLTMGEESSDKDPVVSEALDHLDIAIDAPGGAHAVVVRSNASRETIDGEIDGLRGNFEHYDSHVATRVASENGATTVVSVWTTAQAADTASGFLQDLPEADDVLVGAVDVGEVTSTDDGAATEEIRSALDAEGVYAGVPHGEDVHALVLYSDADTDRLIQDVEELENGFDRYDTHEGTSVYTSTTGDRNAVVSLWDTASAAETASGYLEDLPGIFERAGTEGGFATMGMFYRTKPEHLEDFRDTFGDVVDLIEDMEGHRESDLFANVEDENDMFIASHWREQEDAMAFFRTDAFTETVDWGRDILDDRPRHVFLA